jgi:hypothetical protein
MIIRRLFTATALLAAVAVPATASAQEIGAKAGLNFANIANIDDDFPDSTRRMGLVGGLFVKVPATERFSFQIEGLYSEKGIAVDAEEDGIDLEGDLRLRYIEVPLLARADFTSAGSSANFYVVAGAAPAFKLDARLKVEALDQEETEDVGDEIAGLDLGLVGGVGVEFGRALIEARYTHGMRSIADNDETDDDDVRNRVFSVTIGYRFR